MTIADQVEQLIEVSIKSLGYEIIGVDYRDGGSNAILSVYIDSREGTSIEDCESVSHQISGILDVEELISRDYSLEVSSPGFERPLFKARDFERFYGKKANICMKLPINNRRNFTGLLKGFSNSNILIEMNGCVYTLPFSKLAKARLIA
ncbi:MAG: ribosome maturation factor RimP [Piscirickettsiaceae bacterium]|nr:ribosome maturation factor RimP [Piscirickettsiaceae bacterium]